MGRAGNDRTHRAASAEDEFEGAVMSFGNYLYAVVGNRTMPRKQRMDFFQILKAISTIVVTILGAYVTVVEKRDKASGRLTRTGIAALVVIVAGGITSLVLDVRDALGDRSKAIVTAQRERELRDQLRDMQNRLEEIADAPLHTITSVRFEADLPEAMVSSKILQLVPRPSEQHVILSPSARKDLERSCGLWFRFDIFGPEEERELYSLTSNFLRWFQTPSVRKKPKLRLVATAPATPTAILRRSARSLTIAYTSPVSLARNSGELKTFRDLAGLNLVVEGETNRTILALLRDGARLRSVSLRTANGKDLRVSLQACNDIAFCGDDLVENIPR